jgi:hypothetical protein
MKSPTDVALCNVEFNKFSLDRCFSPLLLPDGGKKAKETDVMTAL